MPATPARATTQRYQTNSIVIPNHCMRIRGASGVPMKSSVIKRSIVIDGHKTSVSLENAFWKDLKEIAQTQQSTLSKLVATIDERRQQGNLSSAIRLFVLEHRRNEYNRKRETKFAEYQLTDTDIQRSHADAP